MGPPTREPGDDAPIAGDETLLARYLREAMTLIEQGEAVDPHRLCASHPELIDPLRDALQLGDATLLRDANTVDPLAGELLSGRYRLQERLGMGAMGAVYRAHDLELKRDVAVKVMARAFPDEIAEQRFAREAELLATLQHPHIVAVFDRGRSDAGLPFLVMEELAGVSLSALLAEREARLNGTAGDDDTRWVAALLDTLPPESSWRRLAARWAAELADGLATAHARGVFHRDIKPSNIFIVADYRAVLLDFGIAARPDDGRLTASETVLGTPWYMPPEQAAGQWQPDASGDVWSLMATLYHLVAGRPPFFGDVHEVLHRLVTEDPVPASALTPRLPRDLAAIIDHGMERAPGRRYPAMPALRDDLQAFLAHLPVRARPITRWGRAWRRVQRRPARAAAVAGLGLTAVLAPVTLWLLSDAQARRDAERVDEIHATLPAHLCVEGQPSQRLVASLSTEHEEQIALLTELLELAPHDLPARLWRAAIHLDQGTANAAAADFEILAEQNESEYFRALAQRYLAVPAGDRGTEAVRFDELPAPRSHAERYVQAFHELRNRHVPGFAERAEAALAPALQHYLPARDLHLIVLLARQQFGPLLTEALQLEGRYGRPTARTRFAVGTALLSLGRYDEAETALEESLALRPDRHGPLLNLGIVHRRQGDLDLAEEYLRQAVAVRPHFWNSMYSLAQLHRDRGEFDRAYDLAAAVAVPAAEQDFEGLRWKKPYLLGSIRLMQVVHARNELGTIDGAHAQQAAEHYEHAAAHAPATYRKRSQVYADIARGLRGADDEQAAAHGMQMLLMQGSVLEPHFLGMLWGLLPAEGIDAEAMGMLRALVIRMAMDLVKGNDDEIARYRALLEVTDRETRAAIQARRGR